MEELDGNDMIAKGAAITILNTQSHNISQVILGFETQSGVLCVEDRQVNINLNKDVESFCEKERL